MCQKKTWAPGNIKISTFIFPISQPFMHGFLCNIMSRSAVKRHLSDCIKYILVGYIVSEILVKSLKLLTLIIHGVEALLYTSKMYPTQHTDPIPCVVDSKIHIHPFHKPSIPSQSISPNDWIMEILLYVCILLPVLIFSV